MSLAPASLPPLVAILLATWNGDRFLDQQLASLAAQQSVRLHVIVGDDASSDRTIEVLADWSRRLAITVLPRVQTRLGSANRNFLRLIASAAVGDAAYVAFCDQDDIWTPDKLQRSIAKIRQLGLDAYSSDVTAIWPDGRQAVIKKSDPQRKFDHLFESAGPGSTFVLDAPAFERLAQWVRANHESLVSAKVHDWLIYAYAREARWRWHIDPVSTVLYRQHAGNELGANRGRKAAFVRLGDLLSGRYARDVLTVAALVGHRSPLTAALGRLTARDRGWLALRARSMRRNGRESALLALSFLLMRAPKVLLPAVVSEIQVPDRSAAG